MLLQAPEQPVHRGPVASLRDPSEDREVALGVEVRPPRAEVEEPEPREPPGLVEVQVEDYFHFQ